ncbi:Dynein heavy chain 2 axonemal [Dissostichus eleginoides]|uniref:Dynein heavy chain 2 axonemal n=1 Tax=Dissostichus eleginoides TaxID=100907 RepID=A0AAD9F330_DISEL|nr:Dynein heavy chain 2 axonemal [Dissostichus eleginoides]
MKARSLSVCVDVYQPWSRLSLVEVAAQCLKTNPPKTERDTSEAGLSVVMAGIHQSACQYASVLLRDQTFSPQTFLEFMAHFHHLCKHLHTQHQSRANRLAAVLSRLDVMSSAAARYKQNLVKLQEEVLETQQRELELLSALDHQRILLEEAQESCVVEENKLYDLEEQISHAHKQVVPVLLSGLKLLSCLNPCDLEEVRHYRDPPEGVVRIMDAVCLLFNRPPGWESAKQLLGQDHFFQELEFFERCSVTAERLQQLALMVHSPQFVPESVQEVSRACESLCLWVKAVFQCCCMQQQLELKQQLEATARHTRAKLNCLTLQKNEAKRRQEEGKIQLEGVREKLKETEKRMQTAERSEREAAAAVEKMETLFTEWRAAEQEAESDHKSLSGDALLLAAIISYLSPFGPDTRSELLNKWRDLSQTGSIKLTLDDPRTPLFTPHASSSSYPPLGFFPIPVSERLPVGRVLGGLQESFPNERMLVKLLLSGNTKRDWVQRWNLLTDTQKHLDILSNSCIHTGEKASLEKETECETVLSADDPDLMHKLDQAAEEGLRVLVTHVERLTPTPRFLERLSRPAGCFLPGLEHLVQPPHPEFCLLLSTDLPAHLLHTEIHPSVLSLVAVLDLSLSSAEIQQLMLTQLLQNKRKKLLRRHSQLQSDKQLLEHKLISEQEFLLDSILQSDSPLLQELLSEELQHHDVLLKAPRNLVKLASTFYQALQELSRLSSDYCFPLQGFISALQEAFIVEGCEVELSNRLVEKLLHHYRPSLYSAHLPALELLLSLALLQHHSRGILLKTLLPHSLQGLNQDMAVYHRPLLGGRETPYIGNPKALYQFLRKHEGPVILTSPNQRGEERTSIHPLNLIHSLAHCGEDTQVQVRVVSFGADREVILSHLNTAATDGHWLVFNNCQLLETWDTQVTTHIHQLISSGATPDSPELQTVVYNSGECIYLHTSVRAMCALPLVVSSCLDLKEQLILSFQQLHSFTQRPSLSGVSSEDMELLMNAAVFHSVILQRHKHRGGRHSWTQEDFLSLVEALLSVATLCQDKAKALQCIAVHLVHGAHVLDSSDREEVDSIAKIFLSGEPHFLSDIIKNTRHFEPSDLLHVLDSESLSDLQLLGFTPDVETDILKNKSLRLNTLLQISQNPPGSKRSSYTQITPSSSSSLLFFRDRLQAVKTFLSHRNLHHCTPSSPEVSHLERRAELLAVYLQHHASSDPPGAFRLSAFRNPRGFLQALRREAALKHCRNISDITLQYQVLSDSSHSLPLDAVYLCGLELRGASWDMQSAALQDSLQPRSLPLVCVKANVRISNRVEKSSDLQEVPPPAASQLPVYLCPLLLHDEGSEDANIIAKIPLYAKLSPVLCSLRRVRLVSLL